MEPQDPPHGTDKLKKRRQDDDVDGESSGQTARPRKKLLHDQTLPEDNAAIPRELEQELEENLVDPVEVDRNYINEQLSSNRSVLMLETVSTRASHCRAGFCIPRLFSKRPNIESKYRFNLLDVTNERAGTRPWYLQPNWYYHISCMELILDLTTVLERGWIKMEGGIFEIEILGITVQNKRFHKTIEDWFEYGGCTFDDDEYDRYNKAYADWKSEDYSRESQHHVSHKQARPECTCGPAPPKPVMSDYFPEKRTSRLLSKILAARAKVAQVDGLPDGLLEELMGLSSEGDSSDSHDNDVSEGQNKSLDPPAGNAEASKTLRASITLSND